MARVHVRWSSKQLCKVPNLLSFSACLALLFCLRLASAQMYEVAELSIPGNGHNGARMGDNKWVSLINTYSCRILSNIGDVLTEPFACVPDTANSYPFLVGLDQNRFLVAYRSSEFSVRVRAWKVLSGGVSPEQLWDVEAEPYTTGPAYGVRYPAIALSGNGKYIFVSWYNDRNRNLYGQILSATSGDVLLGSSIYLLAGTAYRMSWVARPIGSDRFLINSVSGGSWNGDAEAAGYVKVISVTDDGVSTETTTVTERRVNNPMHPSCAESDGCTTFAVSHLSAVAIGSDSDMIAVVFANARASPPGIYVEVLSATTGERLHDHPFKLSAWAWWPASWAHNTHPDVAWLGGNYFAATWRSNGQGIPGKMSVVCGVYQFHPFDRSFSQVIPDFIVAPWPVPELENDLPGNDPHPRIERIGALQDQTIVIIWAGGARIFAQALVPRECPEGEGTNWKFELDVLEGDRREIPTCSTCPMGYDSPARSSFCHNVNECEKESDNNCARHARCQDDLEVRYELLACTTCGETVGSYVCTCSADYRDEGIGEQAGSGAVCNEIPCEDGTDNCRVLVQERNGHVELPPITMSLNFTVSMMFKRATDKRQEKIIHLQSTGGGVSRRLYVQNSDSAAILKIETHDVYHFRGVGYIYANQWYHIVWVSEINMQGVHSDTLYLNGKSQTRTSTLTKTDEMLFDENFLGETGLAGYYSHKFEGWTDDVKIWTRPLRHHELLEAGYAEAIPAEGLLAWWPFAEPYLGQTETIEPVNGYNGIFHDGDFNEKHEAKWIVKDECALESHNCHALATCQDTVNSFACVCGDDYLDEGLESESGLGLVCGFHQQFGKYGRELPQEILNPKVARLGDNKYVLAFPLNNDMMAEVYDLDSGVPSRFLVKSSAGSWLGRNHHFDVSEVVGTNKLVVVYQEAHPPHGQPTSIIATFMNGDTGAVLTEHYLYSSDPNDPWGNADGPRVTSGHDGTVLIVYASNNAPGGEHRDIWAHFLSSSGELLGSQFRVNLNVANNQYNPRVGYLGNNRFACTYIDHTGHGLTIFDSSGNFIAQDEIVNFGDASYKPGGIARVSDGVFVIAHKERFRIFSSESGAALGPVQFASSVPGSKFGDTYVTFLGRFHFALSWGNFAHDHNRQDGAYARVYVFDPEDNTASPVSAEFPIEGMWPVLGGGSGWRAQTYGVFALGDQTEIQFLALSSTNRVEQNGGRRYHFNIFSGEHRSVNVNECEDSQLNSCHAGAVCRDTLESFECTCKAGFFGDGLSCQLEEHCLTQFQCQRNPGCFVGIAPGPCRGDFRDMDQWNSEDDGTCLGASPCQEDKNCVELEHWGQNTMVCCDGTTVEASCQARRCELADTEKCFRLELLSDALPLALHQDSEGREYFFPPMWDCVRQLSMQTLFGATATPFPVDDCETCTLAAGKFSARPGFCFSPQHLLRPKPPGRRLDAWAPAYTGELDSYSYAMVVDLGHEATVQAIEWGLSSRISQTILSFTAYLVRDIPTELDKLEAAWLSAYDIFIPGSHAAAPGSWIPLELVDSRTPADLSEGGSLRDVSRLFRDVDARYVMLQLTTTGQPIIDTFKVLPPFPVDEYCSQGSGFAVCSCPSGFYGSGLVGGCSSASYAVSVPVSLSWATQAQVDARFATVAEWTDYERVMWQVLLGVSTDVTAGENVPHYMVSSMRVSVLEAKPGEWVATMFPLFKTEEDAEAAADRLKAYLFRDSASLMGGTVIYPGPQVQAYNAQESRDCDHEADSGQTCQDKGVCTDSSGGFACECAVGLGLGQRCFPVQECELAHENCHINEVCVLDCDLDECLEELHDCHLDADCINTRAGWDCECKGGYDGDGKLSCEDIDECTNPSQGCHTTALCENTVGGFQCSCKPGHEWVPEDATGANLECFPIDECMLGQPFHDCHPDATCTDTDTSFQCTCNAGFGGPGVNCFDLDECEAKSHNCHAHADCTNTPGDFSCKCTPGWSGSGIVGGPVEGCVDVNECDNQPCNPNAACSNSDGSFSCTCNEGFSGTGLDCLDRNTCAQIGCRKTAVCGLVGGQPACVCRYGYTGDGFLCQEDECVTGSHDCHEHATCHDVEWSYDCECNPGWKGSGTVCHDVDECEAGGIGEQACPAEAHCVNTDGSFECECRTGYLDTSMGLYSGMSCKDIDECATDLDNDCDQNATCSNTAGSFTCTCPDGFTDDSKLGVACRDLDECREGQGTQQCDVNARCVNQFGSFECICYAGFEGNGTVCGDLDECEEDSTNDCHLHAVCTNQVGGFVCDCLQGYEGDGTFCEDVDECETGDFECEANSECSNTLGGYECKCVRGFISVLADGVVGCQDEDECAFGTDKCHQDGGLCHNTDGRYTCNCSVGWTGTGTECTDVDECTEMDDGTLCPGESFCVNSPGSFSCECSEVVGSRLLQNGTCFDVDECLVKQHNCHVNATCNNTDGSFECQCWLGWSGDGVICDDLDECTMSGDWDGNYHNCQDFAVCVNTDGSFTCGCEEGFGGDNCSQVVCPAGTFFTNGTKLCGDCSPGTFAAEGATSCETCAAGTVSGVRASECRDCPTGRFSMPGSSSCNMIKVDTSSSCPECTFLFYISGADRALFRLGGCDCVHLDLSYQYITFIVGAFEGMSQLRSLDLSWNEMRKLERGAFQDLVNLEILNLTGNRLQVINEDDGGTVVNGTSVFVDLVKLDELRISEQRAAYRAASLPSVADILASLSRTGPGSLTELDLSFNRVAFLEDEASDTPGSLGRRRPRRSAEPG